MLNLTKGSPVNLTKGDLLNLSKTSDGNAPPVQWTAGLGWDASGSSTSFDLDASAVIIDSTGEKVNKVVSYQNETIQGVYYGGDNLTGAGKGDDETIRVDLPMLQQSGFDRIVFVVNIYEARKRHQSFANVKNAYIRLLADGTVYAKYQLSEQRNTDCYGMVFAEIKLEPQSGNWVAEAIGREYNFVVRELANFK
jgi:tellurium resistance protein TerD